MKTKIVNGQEVIGITEEMEAYFKEKYEADKREEYAKPMRPLFVPLAIAMKLQEKGFNEQCFAMYSWTGLEHIGYDRFDIVSEHAYFKRYTTLANSELSSYTIPNSNGSKDRKHFTAPLWQQVTEWFRKQHNLHVEVHAESETYFFTIGKRENIVIPRLNGLRMNYGYKEYYEALTKAIEEALRIIS